MAHIQIPDQDLTDQYTVGGTPTTGPFAYTKKFINESDVAVYNGTSLVDPADYTIVGTPDASGVGFDGASITLDVAVSNTTMTLTLEAPNERLTDFPSVGKFNIAQLNTDLDYQIILVQQLKTLIERSLLVPINESLTGLTLPSPVAGKGVKWNPTADGLISTTYDPDEAQTDSAASAAAALASEIAAQAAQTAAEAAQAAAEAVFDSFDDRYLGTKASDPTLDNDGNPLQDGALYFDTTLNVLKVYDLGNTTWLPIDTSIVTFANLLANGSIGPGTGQLPYMLGYKSDLQLDAYASDLNSILSNSDYAIHVSSVTNEPTDMVSRGTVHTRMYSSGTATAVQYILGMDGADEHKMWVRTRQSSTWGAWSSAFDFTQALQANVTKNLSVGYTTDVQFLGSVSVITPDTQQPWLKNATINGNLTINEPTDGNEGGCLILMTVDSSGPYTVTLGSGVQAIGTLPDLAASTTYECRVVKHGSVNTTVEIVEVG